MTTKPMYNRPIRLTVVLLLFGSYSFADKAKDELNFEDHVLPIFTKYCFNCHGKSSPQVGLELRTARLVFRGSTNGKVIVKGNPAKSLLWQKVKSREMPIKDFKLTLKDEELETIRKWIATGAKTKQSKQLPPRAQQQLKYYETQVQPILDAKCTSCHNADAPEAALDLTNVATLIRGSQTGPVIVEGYSEKSLLIRKVASKAMPPKDSENEPLTAEEIKTLTAWIDVGHIVDYVELAPPISDSFAKPAEISAKARSFWAFQPPVVHDPPKVKHVDRIRTPIDAFVLARLEQEQLTMAGDAGKLALMRRATLDLTGVPPTAEEAQRYLADDAPGAYERLVDRLLASPNYGERWGRHWLDTVGYVDTSNKDFNPGTVSLSEGYWRYRDYVIKSTNEDKPWNRFLTEQIAGDEMTNWRDAKTYSTEQTDLLIATGFLRNALDATDEDISNLPFDRYEAMFKLMERVSTSTLGLTLACARCHDHKFDPIPQSDYYRFLSLFAAAYNPTKWLQPKRRFLLTLTEAEQKRLNAAKAQLGNSTKQLTDLRNIVRNRLKRAKLAQLPAEIRDDTAKALATPDKKRSAVDKYLASKFVKRLTISDAAIAAALTAKEKRQIATFRKQISIQQSIVSSMNPEKLQALYDVGQQPPMRVLNRGEVDFPGLRIRPGFLAAISTTDVLAKPSPNAVGQTSGYRLAFAEWLTAPQHPLTARVIVNRIWQHHFGIGLVATPGNFGHSGSRPSHPELLDWLALRFIQDGWSAKKLHKLIMMSSVYRQSSHQPEDDRLATRIQDIDPNNRLLSRMSLRRLEAEAIRDSLLSVSHQLDAAQGGKPVATKADANGMLSVPSDQGKRRRSIYLLARRTYPLTLLTLFDYLIIDANCTRRVPSATPLQSLALMNSPFVTNCATALSNNIRQQSEQLNEKITLAYWQIYTRPPTEHELKAASGYIEQIDSLQATTKKPTPGFNRFVHMLLCSNEFLYVE